LNIEKVIQEDRQAKLTVEYSNEEFEGFKRRAAKRISKNAKIPGFRPGKAPYQVVVNHYGDGAIVQEAIDLLIDEEYSKILKEADIEPSGVGNLESLDNFDPPKFVLYIPLEPEINLGEYREFRKAYELADFDVSSVDDYITSLRRNSATIIPAEHPAEFGDLVYFNLSGEFLNPGEDEDATITDKTPQQVIIPSEDDLPENEWPYPGFSRMLLGVNGGDVKEFQHTYPDDHEEEDYQGKTAVFTAEVQSVKALELPEFDEEFVQTLGNYETAEDFRAALEERMRVEHEETYESGYINALLSEIAENASLNYPPQMLEHEQEHVLEDIKSRLENQKLDFETYLKLRDTDEETFIAEEVQPVAQQRLERSLVVDALIEAEGLKLDKDLFNEQVSGVMNEIFRSGKVEGLQKEMGKDEFSRMISMEGFSRTMNTQLKNRLKLIGTGQPIPEAVETSEGETDDAEEVEVILEVDDEQVLAEMQENEPEDEPVESEPNSPSQEVEEPGEESPDSSVEADLEEPAKNQKEIESKDLAKKSKKNKTEE
jgi:trigger factor